MRFLIKNTQYHPNDGPISLYIEDDDPDPIVRNYLNLTAADVAAVTPAGHVWDDPEILAAGRVALELRFPGKGHTLDYPDPPAPPPEIQVGE
jgi:hypothetical protein